MAYKNKSLRIIKKCVHKMSNYIHFCVKISYQNLCTKCSTFRPKLTLPILKTLMYCNFIPKI
jgi:hypothetical protein